MQEDTNKSSDILRQRADALDRDTPDIGLDLKADPLKWTSWPKFQEFMGRLYELADLDPVVSDFFRHHISGKADPVEGVYTRLLGRTGVNFRGEVAVVDDTNRFYWFLRQILDDSTHDQRCLALRAAAGAFRKEGDRLVEELFLAAESLNETCRERLLVRLAELV